MTNEFIFRIESNLGWFEESKKFNSFKEAKEYVLYFLGKWILEIQNEHSIDEINHIQAFILNKDREQLYDSYERSHR